MTVLTQLSVGAFAAIWLLHVFGGPAHLGAAALTSFLVAGLALNASTLHLGRPIHAYRALKMWKRSWLSREVLLFTAFSGVAASYATALWFALPGGVVLGGLTSLLGIGGVTASACIYRVVSRPAWNTRYTLFQFNLTAGTLGPLLAAAVSATSGERSVRWLALAAAAMAGAQLALIALRFFRLVAAGSIELQGSARLLSTTLRSRFLARGALLAIGGIMFPLLAQGAFLLWVAFVIALAGELLGRYLFFVSVVPKHMAAPYLELGSEAA
jgi:DMSO reductase anchor subunit